MGVVAFDIMGGKSTRTLHRESFSCNRALDRWVLRFPQVCTYGLSANGPAMLLRKLVKDRRQAKEWKPRTLRR